MPVMDLERLLAAAWQGVLTFLRAARRALAQLFHEVTGVFFLLFAVVGGLALAREYQRWATGSPRPGRLAVAAAFTLVFLWFGVTSFWRARRRRQGLN